MTPAELRALIESDPQALQLAQAGAADVCAKRCMEIAPKVRVSTMGTERLLYEKLGALVGETILAKLEAFSATQDQMAPLVKRVLGWLKPSNGGTDWGSQELITMAGALKLKDVITADELIGIESLSLVTPTITGADVTTAYPFPGGV